MPIWDDTTRITPSCFGKAFWSKALECSVCPCAYGCSHLSAKSKVLPKSAIRTQILNVLKDGAMTSGDIQQAISSFSNKPVSSIHYHLSLLKRRGAVCMKRDGSRVMYHKSKNRL